jgi:hypothetical protein
MRKLFYIIYKIFDLRLNTIEIDVPKNRLHYSFEELLQTFLMLSAVTFSFSGNVYINFGSNQSHA